MTPPDPPPLRPAPGVEAPLPPAARTAEVRSMFSQIVPRYDLMNRLMTGGMDGRWRRRAVRAALEGTGARGGIVLDLGTGTGDLARDLRRAGVARVVASDFARPMLLAGRRKPGLIDDSGVHWLLGDALQLPFADDSFDAVTSGFLLRNLGDLPAAFAEMLRVLRPGGRLVALDMTHPPPGAWGALTRLGVERVVTPLAGWTSGRRSAYRYLRRSLEGHPDADAMIALLRAAGAGEAGYERMGVGAVALHTASKPANARRV
ncbi:MAG: ubiquinone/menaquinone biosynthesis methyltransferase [Chloroflexota bacterium]|nr:ubiquinone/menaquinone biosynthesis methyltransferase [Chloroflexota bacterium]